MPYQNEFAQYEPLRRVSESERVKALLSSYRIRNGSSNETPRDTINIADLRPSGWTPSWVLAIDGSFLPVDVQNGYPGAEACYVTVASVLLNIAKTRELDKRRPVEPKEF